MNVRGHFPFYGPMHQAAHRNMHALSSLCTTPLKERISCANWFCYSYFYSFSAVKELAAQGTGHVKVYDTCRALWVSPFPWYLVTITWQEYVQLSAVTLCAGFGSCTTSGKMSNFQPKLQSQLARLTAWIKAGHDLRYPACFEHERFAGRNPVAKWMVNFEKVYWHVTPKAPQIIY